MTYPTLDHLWEKCHAARYRCDHGLEDAQDAVNRLAGELEGANVLTLRALSKRLGLGPLIRTDHGWEVGAIIAAVRRWCMRERGERGDRGQARRASAS